MINKPKFWDKKKGFYAFLLFPITLLILFFIFLKKKISRVHKFNIPIVCVGNIYVGGTGKTPLSIYLGKELTNLGMKPVILRKFYESHKDEHNLIKNDFENLFLCQSRLEALKELENSNHDIVILDDGLQDYSIKKNLSIVCFNQNQLIGNGLVLPSGPLRENLNSLKSVQIVIINGEKNEKFEKQILKINPELEIIYSRYQPVNIQQFLKKKLFAIAGIGNPENFFNLLKENNLIIEKEIIFPDHHRFSYQEIKGIIDNAKEKNCEIIMTEKDFFKIKDFKLNEINYLKVSLEIHNKDLLINKVKRLND